MRRNLQNFSSFGFHSDPQPPSPFPQHPPAGGIANPETLKSNASPFAGWSSTGEIINRFIRRKTAPRIRKKLLSRGSNPPSSPIGCAQRRTGCLLRTARDLQPMNQWQSLRSLIELPSPREKKLSLEVTIKPTIQAHPLLTSPLLSSPLHRAKTTWDFFFPPSASNASNRKFSANSRPRRLGQDVACTLVGKLFRRWRN